MPQARTINEKQAKAMFAFLSTGRNAARNRAMFALSYFCGLRAKEIACLTVGDVLKADRSIKDVSYLRAAVRRQSFWVRRRPDLRECLAHPFGLIMRRICGEASVAFRWSSV